MSMMGKATQLKEKLEEQAQESEIHISLTQESQNAQLNVVIDTQRTWCRLV